MTRAEQAYQHVSSLVALQSTRLSEAEYQEVLRKLAEFCEKRIEPKEVK